MVYLLLDADCFFVVVVLFSVYSNFSFSKNSFWNTIHPDLVPILLQTLSAV